MQELQYSHGVGRMSMDTTMGALLDISLVDHNLDALCVLPYVLERDIWTHMEMARARRRGDSTEGLG